MSPSPISYLYIFSIYVRAYMKTHTHALSHASSPRSLARSLLVHHARGRAEAEVVSWLSRYD